MTPDPTPVAGMTPLLPESLAPVTVIRTTAGLTLAATAIVADDSSMVTGWVEPVLVAWLDAGAGAIGRSSAPAAPSARTVPPEASTADSTAAARIVPPRPPRPPPLVVVAAAGVWLAAGSYQRSGVTGVLSSHERAHPARGSGAGV